MKSKKKKNTIVILCVILGILSIALFIIGGTLSGWDLAKYFKSSQAKLLLVLFFLFGAFIVCFLLLSKDRNDRL